MKKYIDKETGVAETLYFVAHRDEVKTLYKSILRASRKGNTELIPAYRDFPIFSPEKQVYALAVDLYDGRNRLGWFQIVNSDTMLHLIMDGDVVEFALQRIWP